MKIALVLLMAAASLAAAAESYYSLSVYAPDKLQLDGKVINAVDSNFIIGALRPSTSCNLFNAKDCPPGNTTLVNEDMTSLAAAVPGGQFIFISPDGSITYSAAHSNRRPAGAQMGGFNGFQVVSRCGSGNPISVFTWQSEDGATGLWACQAEPNIPISTRAVLKASTRTFGGAGCQSIQALQIFEVGGDFAAWQYT